MAIRLKRVFLNGFKSFAYHSQIPQTPAEMDLEPHVGKSVNFGDVTVLLGANGAGKSNLVAFFKMLNYMMTGALQEYIGQYGGADSLLHYGARVTPQMDARVEFEGADTRSTYMMRFASAAPDTLIFTDETVEYHKEGHPIPRREPLGAGHRESLLEKTSREGNATCKVFLSLLRRCRVFQFHDTSDNSRVRKPGYIEDTGYLRSDAGNLAAYLGAMKENHVDYYDRIIRTIRQVCPQFGDFVLEPSDRSPNYVLLNWREKHHPDYLMGPHQLSDGTLRFMALATLFLQPPERLPTVIVIDEPELGLHPDAIAVLAGLIEGVSTQTQVVLATQSETFVNHFGVSQITPIEHSNGASRVLHLNAEDFSEWLEDYTTGELWEKNVFGGVARHE